MKMCDCLVNTLCGMGIGWKGGGVVVAQKKEQCFILDSHLEVKLLKQL